MAVRPDDFACGRRSMDGGPWSIFGVDYWINPKFRLPPWVWDMLRLWRLYQGGLGGVGHLPEDGGGLNQSPVMLDAFAVMSAAETALSESK